MALVAGHDYPHTYREFVAMFPDNPACLEYQREIGEVELTDYPP